MSKKPIEYNKAQIEKIKSSLKEAPISFEGPERMDPEIQRKIEAGDFPGAGSGAFPKVPEEGVHDTFEELVASERFKEVVDNVKHYTGMENISGRAGMMQLQGLLMQSVMKILEIEANHKQQLEELAVKLVIEEMGISPGSLQFDAKIVGMGEISMEGMQPEEKEPTPEQQDAEEEAFEEFEEFDLQKQKRRFLNQLIQGASKKGHYWYQFVEQELNEIDPELINLYGVMMSINDLVYWVAPDQTTTMMAKDECSMCGKEEIDIETDPPTVIAKGITFPVLVHELIKGVMEVFATQGLPDDPDQAQLVMDSQDTIVGEIWDLRLGPVIWGKFQAAYPSELMEEEKRELQNYLFALFARMDVKDMFRLTKNILSGNEEGAKEIESMVKEIVDHLNKKAYEEALPSEKETYDDDDDGITTIDDDEGGDALGALNIPQEEPEGEMTVDGLLDKISATGLDSLTPEEKAFLRRQS